MGSSPTKCDSNARSQPFTLLKRSATVSAQPRQGLLATVRVLASDLDGTLLNPEHKPGKGTFDAIAEFEEAGGVFAVCTGRDKGSARAILKGLDIDHLPGVYMNGTIVQGLGGAPLQSAVLPQALVKEVVEWGRTRRDIASILFVDGEVHYVMDQSEANAMYMHLHLQDPEPLQLEGGWEAAEPKIPGHVNLMRVICQEDKMDLVKSQVKKLVAGKANFAQSLKTTIDIMAPNTNKATGLSVLLKSLNLSEAQTAAIGDSENDLEMLQSVRVACAMGNAVQKTKAVAHFVMPSNTDDPPGVVCLLRQVTAALKAKASKEGPKVEAEAVAPRPKIKVATFGAGGWGTPVARMVGQSVLSLEKFDEELLLWVNPADEAMEDGGSLSEVINRTRENPKYAPGMRLPRSLTATADAKAAARGADVLIFVERQAVLRKLLAEIAPEVKKSAVAVVMSKDLVETHNDRLRFGSQVVAEQLGIPVAALMGGTLACDVAAGHFAEATLGCEDPETALMLTELFNKPNFHVDAVHGVQVVELFAVLKTVVSIAGGICDGLNYGTNTKAAIVRLGAVEMAKLAARFYPEQASAEVLDEACGWTDLIVSSFGNSRNRRWAEAFAKDPARPFEDIAGDVDGKLPTGIQITAQAAAFVRSHHAKAEFPFLCKVARILALEEPPISLIDMAVPHVRRTKALKVAVLGSGAWGTALARLIATNVARLPDFQKEVAMWVHEEMVDGRKITEIINEDHKTKYLPGFDLPHNILAVPDPVEAVKDAHVLVFVVPHQFLDGLLDKIAGSVSSHAMALTCIKGHMVVEQGGKVIRTGSQVISERLQIGECAVLNGANVADQVAAGEFAEATLGCSDEERALLLTRLFNTPRFSVRPVPDVLGVELAGGLKNVVALGAGFCDGLGLAENTKGALLRRGLLEMGILIRELFPTSKRETLQESCGIADLLTTCYSGRNHAAAKVFAEKVVAGESPTWDSIESEVLKGGKLQGPSCCVDVQAVIDHRGLRERLPLFTAIHGAVTKAISPQDVFTTNGFHL